MATPTLLAAFDFAALRALLAELGADGWLLFDFHGINPVVGHVLGLGHGLATRRLFVWLPRAGAPVAVAHKIELGPFGNGGFPGEVRPYAAWPELHAELARLVGGKTVAMEISPRDNVPICSIAEKTYSSIKLSVASSPSQLQPKEPVGRKTRSGPRRPRQI